MPNNSDIFSTAASPPPGWQPISDADEFSRWIGPVLERTEGDATRYAMATHRRHGNRNGVVHGGVLMTLADKAIGTIVRRSARIEQAATVQLDHQFTRRVDIGDFVEAECEIIRAARRLVFVTCTMSVRGKVVGTTTALLNVRGGGDDAE